MYSHSSTKSYIMSHPLTLHHTPTEQSFQQLQQKHSTNPIYQQNNINQHHPNSINQQKQNNINQHQLQRRQSTSNIISSNNSLKQYIDVDKLICDIKITPSKSIRNSSNQFKDNAKTQKDSIKNIMEELTYLKNSNPNIQDQVRTVELLMECIQKKISNNLYKQIENINRSSIKKELVSSSTNNTLPLPLQQQLSQKLQQKTNTISPIKKLWDDHSSRVGNTNISRRQLQTNYKNIEDHQNIVKKYKEIQNSTNKKHHMRNQSCIASSIMRNSMEIPLFTPQKISKFQNQENDEVEKLNSQIKVLESMLRNKGVHEIVDKKSFYKNSIASRKSNKIEENKTQGICSSSSSKFISKNRNSQSINRNENATIKRQNVLLERNLFR